jgi:hypothetical protein
VAPQSEKAVHRGWTGLLESSSGLLSVPGVEVDDARDDSWRRCFVASAYLPTKPSHVGVDVDGLAYPLHHHMTCSHQTRGQGVLSGVALSHHAAVGGGAFLGNVKPLDLDIRWSVDCLGTYVIESSHGVNHFYQGTLILCQSHHGTFTCICGGLATSRGDGMDSSTRVYVVRCTWAPAATSYLDRQ